MAEGSGDSAPRWDPVKIPAGLTCKNTFFDVPSAEDVALIGAGPATCPPPTEGWWSAGPSPSRPPAEVPPAAPMFGDLSAPLGLHNLGPTPDPTPGVWNSALPFHSTSLPTPDGNPYPVIGPTPDWFSTPMPTVGGGNVVASTESGGGGDADEGERGFGGRFDRLLTAAMEDSDEEESPSFVLPTSAPPSPSSKGFPAIGPTPDWHSGSTPTHSGCSNNKGFPAIGPTPDWHSGSTPTNSGCSTSKEFPAIGPTPDWHSGSTPTPSGCPAMGHTPDWFSTPMPMHAPGGGGGLGGLGGGRFDRLLGAATEECSDEEDSSPVIGRRGSNPGLGSVHAPMGDAAARSVPMPISVPPPAANLATAPVMTLPLPQHVQSSGVAPRVVVDLSRELGLPGMGLAADPSQDAARAAPKARRRRGSKEAKDPDRGSDDTWWLPTLAVIDLGGLMRVAKAA